MCHIRPSVHTHQRRSSAVVLTTWWLLLPLLPGAIGQNGETVVVQCGSSGPYCPTQFPVCCVNNNNNYCVLGGMFCCDFATNASFSSSSAPSYTPGCPVGTSCCLSRDGSLRKSCCNAEEVCDAWNGTCAPRAKTTTPAVVNGTSSQCSAQPDCDRCVGSQSQCAWCSSTATCDDSAATACNPFALVVNASSGCPAVSVGGSGLYHTTIDLNNASGTGLLARYFATTTVSSTSSGGMPPWVISLCALCALSFVVAGAMFAHRVRPMFLRHMNVTSVPQDPVEVIPMSDNVDATHTPMYAIVKYGFDAHTPLTELEDEVGDILRQVEAVQEVGEDMPECIVCLDKAATVTLLPCRHLCCCVGCGLRLEQNVISLRNRSVHCPLCRKEVVSMVNVETRLITNASLTSTTNTSIPTEPFHTE